ncbi:4540_t:CDS:2 [Entrophospora sp. SA101]|nr:4540_t:CDS:2 [Entrophospora sp. SA101]
MTRKGFIAIIARETFINGVENWAYWTGEFPILAIFPTLNAYKNKSTLKNSKL